MNKQDISVDELVKLIERGELELPEMQRRYVWQAPRVRDLLDSLYRGYPSGSILVWESEKAVPTQEMAIQQASTPFMGRKLLLDGQQRLTSLAAVLRGKPVKVRGRQRPIDILFNLEHPQPSEIEVTEVVSEEEESLFEEVTLPDEENGANGGESDETNLQERLKRRRFVVASKALARLPNWVSVTEVFRSDTDVDILNKAGVTLMTDPRYARYTRRLQRLRKIRDYPYVMHVLGNDLSYVEVTEIFVRVNSLGVKLRSSDLALAQITARWPNSLKLLEKFQEECEDKWFTLDLGLLVRMMVIFATKQSKFNIVTNTGVEKFKQAWEVSKRGIEFAINFLRANADVEDESLLSSPFLIAPIAVYSQLHKNKLSDQDTRHLLYWLHVANVRGRYGRGSSESLLNEDLTILFKDGKPEDLLEPMRRQFGRLHVEAGDFVGRGDRSPLFSLAYLATKAGGAKDWFSGLELSLAHQGQAHFIQYHHIFPKSLLKKAGYEKAEINEIANMTFISGQTNRRLSDKEPAVYMKDIVKRRRREALTKHFIPADESLLKIENYRKFLEVRRELLATTINKHLQQALDDSK